MKKPILSNKDREILRFLFIEWLRGKDLNTLKNNNDLE